MSAETLRRAAQIMRRNATAADDMREFNRGIAKLGRLTPKGQHLAGMTPAVAVAVADWLDSVAGACTSPDEGGLHAGRSIVQVVDGADRQGPARSNPIAARRRAGTGAVASTLVT